VPQPRSTMNIQYDPAKGFDVAAPLFEAETPPMTGGTPAPLAGRIRVIGVVPNQIVTRELIEEPRVEKGKIVPDVERDILKLVVLERHHATGNVGIGFVRGFQLKTGALGSTVAHDAHNVVVVGTNDADIVRAVDELENMRGGQVAVAGGAVRARLPLPIAGLV